MKNLRGRQERRVCRPARELFGVPSGGQWRNTESTNRPAKAQGRSSSPETARGDAENSQAAPREGWLVAWAPVFGKEILRRAHAAFGDGSWPGSDVVGAAVKRAVEIEYVAKI